MGFGTIQPKAIIWSILYKYPNLSVFKLVFIANSPQLIVTISYYFYNSVLTGMLAASEYNSYGIKRKPLRVSFPQKGSLQRSTYWLTVPYRYSIPLISVYMVLHWLISESIFYVQLVPYDLHQQPRFDSKLSALGFSPIAIIFALIVGGVMMLALVSLGVGRRLKSDMPLAGSCSAAISAQCHLSIDDDREVVALGDTLHGGRRCHRRCGQCSLLKVVMNIRRIVVLPQKRLPGRQGIKCMLKWRERDRYSNKKAFLPES